MPVTATHLATASSESDATSYNTASISPSASRLILVFFAGTSASSGPPDPTITGNGFTYTKVATLVDASNTRIVGVYRAMGTPSAGAVTISFGAHTMARLGWSIAEFANVKTSGVNGADAVVQSATNQNTGSQTTLSVTLAAFGSANNATYGGIRRSATSGTSSGSGFTQLGVDTANSATIQSQWRNDNDTGVDWTWPSDSSVNMAVALEIAFQAAADGAPGDLMLLDVGR